MNANGGEGGEKTTTNDTKNTKRGAAILTQRHRATEEMGAAEFGYAERLGCRILPWKAHGTRASAAKPPARGALRRPPRTVNTSWPEILFV